MNFSVDNIRLFTLNVGHAEHLADWNWQHVRSPFARLYYVTEGKAKVILHGNDDELVRLRAGHLYFIPPFMEHTDICSEPFSHYYIHVYEDSLDGVNLLSDLEFPRELKAADGDLNLFETLANLNPFMRLEASDPSSYDNHRTLMRNMSVNLQRELYNKMESRGILYILLSRFLRYAQPKSKITDKRIGQSLVFIREHITERISMDMLAEQACMSKDHFIRRFKSETGVTPNAYITQRKIERAELLLITTDLPVKEIADSLDFSDHAYFNRVFKNSIGCSPRQYRMQHI